MKTFYAELVAPEKVLFAGEITRLTVNAIDGGMEVLASHIPSICAINTGKCTITLPDNTKKVFMTEDGILRIQKDKVVVTSDLIEWEEDFERVIGEREKYIESEISRRHESYKEYKLSSVALQRTLANLKRERTSKR